MKENPDKNIESEKGKKSGGNLLGIKNEKILNFWNNIKSLIWIIVIVLVIRSAFAAPYKIPTGSMIPSLEIGDHIFVSKFSFALKLPVPFTNFNLITWDKPKRGDVIVFEYPEDMSLDFVKRVVGLPGDIIEYKDKKLFINGKLQEILPVNLEKARYNRYGGEVDSYRESLEGFLHSIQFYKDFPPDFSCEYCGPIKIPEDNYFVMGDNRDDSRDSRYWQFVPFKNIRGKAKIVWFSWNNETDSLIEKIRFDRLFKLIK